MAETGSSAPTAQSGASTEQQRIPIIFTGGVTDFVMQVIAKLQLRSDLEVIQLSDMIAAFKQVKQSNYGVVINQLLSDKKVAEALAQMRPFKDFIKGNAARIVTITNVKHPKLEKVLHDGGCAEMAVLPVTDKAFIVKIDRQIRVISARMKKDSAELLEAERRQKHMLSRQQKQKEAEEKRAKVKAEMQKRGGGTGSENKKAKVTWKPPIKLKSDFWYLGGSSPRRVNRRWIFTAKGPGPMTVKWVEAKEEEIKALALNPAHDPIWKLEAADDDAQGFFLENGHWFVQGMKPDFREDRWMFVGFKLLIGFAHEGKWIAKRSTITETGDLEVSKDDSGRVAIFAELIEASLEKVIKAKKEAEARGEVDVKDKESAAIDEVLAGEEEEVEAEEKEKVEGEDSEEEIDAKKAEKKELERAAAVDGEEEKSGVEAEETLEGKKKKKHDVEMAAAVEEGGKSRVTEEEASEVERKKKKNEAEDLGGALEGKTATEDLGGGLEGKAATEDLGGALEGKTATDDLGGVLDGKNKTDTVGGDPLSGEAETEKIASEPLSGEIKTEEQEETKEKDNSVTKATAVDEEKEESSSSTDEESPFKDRREEGDQAPDVSNPEDKVESPEIENSKKKKHKPAVDLAGPVLAGLDSNQKEENTPEDSENQEPEDKKRERLEKAARVAKELEESDAKERIVHMADSVKRRVDKRHENEAKIAASLPPKKLKLPSPVTVAYALSELMSQEKFTMREICIRVNKLVSESLLGTPLEFWILAEQGGWSRYTESKSSILAAAVKSATFDGDKVVWSEDKSVMLVPVVNGQSKVIGTFSVQIKSDHRLTFEQDNIQFEFQQLARVLASFTDFLTKETVLSKAA